MIARTGCHTIDLPHRGATPHPHWQTEVSHHPTQDGELLPVLFSQPKLIRTHQGQQTADDGDHAIEVANSTAFGLSSGVCTNSLPRAQAYIEGLNVGTVNIWEQPGYRIEMSPFGGIKDSGNGVKEGVLEAMKFFTNVKTYSLPWP